MAGDTLAVAVVGAGSMGSDHVRRLDERIAGARVAAVADTDAERAKHLAHRIPHCTAFTDAADALAAPGVDAVLIASPAPAHEEALVQAFARGLPVLCEKPLTPGPDAALRILEAEQRLGRQLVQVGFMRRHDPDYLRLKSQVDSGGLGRLLMLHCRHRNVASPPGFTNQMILGDSVVHEADAVRWLSGQEITAVQVLRPASGAAAPPGLDDPQLVVFETSGGVIADVEVFVNCGFGYQVQCEAVCERGTARIGEEGGLHTQTAGRWGGDIPQDYVTRFRAAYDREVQVWVDAARGGSVQGPNAWDGYAAAAVTQAGVRAQSRGVRVEVELADRPAFYH